MLSPKALALSAQRTKKLSLTFAARILTLLRFLLVNKSQSAAAARTRRLMLAGIAGTTGFSLLLNYVARCFCQTPWEVAHLTAHIGYAIAKTVVAYIARGFKPLFPNWTFGFEVARAVMRCATELYGHRVPVYPHAKHIRRVSEVLGSSLGWFYGKVHASKVEPVHVNGLEHLWIKSSKSRPASSSRDSRFVVVFYHGGGYAVLSPRMYIPFCNTFRTAIQDELRAKHNVNDPHVDFFLANYRKVPEHPFPIPAQDAVSMYEYVVEHLDVPPSRIIVAGDSAGGGLTMSTLLRLRDSKPSISPLAAILICPLVDLSVNEASTPTPHCILSPSIIAACRAVFHETLDDPSTWLDASPVHCDLRNLSPVFLLTASFDYLHNHSQDLFKKATQDGVTNWEIDIQLNVPHVFTVFPTPVLPQAMVGIQNMAAFAAKHFHQATALSTEDTEIQIKGEIGAAVVAA